MRDAAASPVRAPLVAAALSAAAGFPASAQGTADRVIEVFARACLAERPDFEGSPAALAELGLARGEAGPFFASADRTVMALPSAGIDLPEGTAPNCTVLSPVAEGARRAAVAARLTSDIPAPLTHHEGGPVAAGSFAASETHAWTWEEPGHRGKAVLALGEERGIALSVVMTPAGEGAQ